MEKSPKRLGLVILSVGLALVPIGWIVISHSRTAVSARAPSDVRAIALQSPGAVLREGGNGMERQTMLANCAKGFVRRGAICEVDPAAQMVFPAASNRSVRPPERE